MFMVVINKLIDKIPKIKYVQSIPDILKKGL